ncbi:hypothetical protein HJC23_000304 [Cyclotella cryptica]|uniref:Uncharacterized protein n=1 Tax=Cyclotella cryptica TaxID=29204 RepID=A0ABD3P4G9_9STRA|eukprot:CCRYP_018001-RA/>CCRYP_018001-RA protein AED:0.24 eAED:0.25 QI:0/1/0.66/1/1/1/3/133/1696
MTCSPDPRRCPGGFCNLHLPTTFTQETDNSRNKQPPSKREKRLLKSLQRDRALRVLQWTLRTEEYSRLEENGDLVRLRVRDYRNSDNTVGKWIKEEEVRLARREHRPELARLAFAEFSAQEKDGVNNTSKCASNESCAVLMYSPLEDGGNDDCVLVCGVCFTVYHLLKQSRELLNSFDETQHIQHEKITSTKEMNEEEANNSTQCQVATINQVEDIPSNNLKKCKTEGSSSIKWIEGNRQQTSPPVKKSSSFHGPMNTAQEERGKSVASSVGKKRDRKKMEENSKILVLIADSDDTTTKLAKRLLEKQGYKVDTSSNGADCCKFLEQRSYSILLINETLSGKDAPIVGRWVRKREESEQVIVKMRILVLVQRILAVNYHDYDDLDVDGFLAKPLEGSKLLPSVEKSAMQYLEAVQLAEVAKAIAAEKNQKEQEQQEQEQPTSLSAANTAQERASESLTSEHAPKRRSNRGKAKPSKKSSPQKACMYRTTDKLKREDPETFESTFHFDDNTSFPYAILCNGSETNSSTISPSSDTLEQQRTPWCNLIVCQDVFDTYERHKIFFLPMVARYTGMRILLWNYPGQAFTTFSDNANLNNKYHAECLFKLLEHVKGSGKGKFNSECPFFLMAHGSGAAIATYFASVYHSTCLRGLVLINGLSYVDSHYASVFHDCRNVFSCSPESRPDLPVYFYARFLFSPSYLSKTSSSLALNIYTAVHNPITLNGRKRLCQGVLNHVDIRPLLKDIPSPIITVHGENATLVRALHAAEFLKGRRSCPTIPQALRGGNRSAVVMMKGGHELFQEKKDQIALLIEQILTGYYDKAREPLSRVDFKDEIVKDSAVENKKTKEVYQQTSKRFEDKFIDNVLKESRGGRSSWDIYQEEIMMEHQSNLQNKTPSKANLMKKEQTQHSNHAKDNSTKEFDPNEYPEVKEYMAWRIRRHKKRLAVLDRSARVIQCALRCFMAKTMMGRVRKEKAAMFIQRHFRGSLGRNIYRMKKKQLWAARFVQRTLRGHRGRCVSYSMRMEKRAQVNVARMMRGLFARRRFQAVLANREKAATKIQGAWRMHAAMLLKKHHRRRRYASTVVQKLYRGHRGRKKAASERDKYIFSRSQNSGIEIGRQLLAEHKLHATKIQSELSLLNQQTDKIEKQIQFHLTEISNFDRTVSRLENKMHQISNFERASFGVLATSKQIEMQEEKRRMDEEFSETLAKISDRKVKLEQLESTFEKLIRTRQEKFGQLKSLEGKLAVLLDAQDSALESIRKKKEQRIDSLLPPNPRHATPTPQNVHQQSTIPGHPPSKSDVANLCYYSGPHEKDKLQAAKLIDSTEQMMKFGFMSMSLTYFSSLNMMRAMQRVSVNDTLTAPTASSMDPSQYTPQLPNTLIPNLSLEKRAAVKVESWSVNDVSKWLESISLSQYQSSFKEGAVDGSFLCELTDDDLRNTLGVEHRLHRKKILFSIHCLKNYAETHSSQHSTPIQGMQPNHYGTNASKTTATMSPNTTTHESIAFDDARGEAVSYESSYSSDCRQYESVAVSPSKASSVLDILTPSTTETRNVLLCDFDQLRFWVRHQKHENIREALNNVADTVFQPKHIRVQFTEDIGTSYTVHYERDPFNLNKTDEHGNTLMHIAAQTGNIRIAKLLIRKGSNPNHQNKQGQTPGHFAVAYHFFDFASWLFDEKGGGANDLLTNMHDLGPYDGLEYG